MVKFLAGIFLFLLLAAQAVAGSPEDDFVAAREAFRVGDAARLDLYARRLGGYLLEPYVLYYQLRMRLEDADPASVKAFLDRYGDTPLADRLRAEWLKVLGKKGQWDLFGAEYPRLFSEDAELTCYALQARLALKDTEALQEARPLWFIGRELPDSCTPLFDALVTGRMLNTDDVWARIRLALGAGNVSAARRANQYLPAGQMIQERALDAAADNPLRYLERSRHEIKTRADRELALFALLRVARNGPQQAYAYWPKLRDRFSAADRSYFMGLLAYYGARRLDPSALQWFAEAGDTPLGDWQLAWKARVALRAENWQAVLGAIEAMSPVEQREGNWRYWKGRALKAQGKIPEANAIFAPLSTEHNFYGQLAGEELGVSIGPPAESYKPGKEEIKAVQELPGIQRALALYRLSMRTEGTREWLWAIRGFDDRQLLAAAEVARRSELYDRAISTADRTVQLHDFSLRYLAPYREILQENLKQLDLDEALVYGLIRQESRFITDAKSSAGAQGLMQLMPTTAKWVAKKLGWKDYRQSLANQVDVNLALGTYYLKHVLDSLDNQPLLASAGYNAGPARVRQWRDQKPLEGAIYAETIPFNETRDYVKKVMSNAMYYASAFGQQWRSLKQRLGTVAPRSNNEKPLEEEK